VRASLGRIGNTVERLRQVVGGFGAARHLYESYSEFLWQGSPGCTGGDAARRVSTEAL
jgi:hypothetical protein